MNTSIYIAPIKPRVLRGAML